MKKSILLLLVVYALGCEMTIHPELESPAEILVVDAWLIHNKQEQVVKLSKSQGYFEDQDPEPITGALVKVLDQTSGVVYNFAETDLGYRYTADSTFGVIGHEYQLSIEVEGDSFSAKARLGAVPAVDSVVFSHNPEDFNILSDYYSAEFFATDLQGDGNTYWIKTWKNGILLNKPSEINIAYDAGFGAGQQVDGVVFHKSIRRDFINPLEEREDRANYYYPPYDIGDSVYVEIHSIDQVAYDYLVAVKTQTDRPGGFSELFAVPLSNVITNVQRTDRNSSTPVAGFFNVAAVSAGGKKLTQQLANQLQD